MRGNPISGYWRSYLRVLATFRNGWQMILAHQRQMPCGRAVFWDGSEIVHPLGRRGLVETVIELWSQCPYTEGGFYRPREGDLVLDVGAHVGMFTIWIQRRSPGCAVIALEPSAENFSFLKRNIAAHGNANVTIHRVALGGRPGVGQMVARGGRSLDHTLTSLGGSTSSSSESEDRVPIIDLHGLLEMSKRDRVSLLKMDIEGAEYDVFINANASMLRRFERIAIEFHEILRPGTLELLKARLASTHRLTVENSDQGWGILRARLR
jgi:FkbM family methyltransferase